VIIDMQEKAKIVRYPRLNTLKMIEKATEDAKGDYTVRQIWQKLPKKVMWQTYLTALDYLEESNKILIDKKYVIWIWDPKGIAKIKRQKQALKEKLLKNQNSIL